MQFVVASKGRSIFWGSALSPFTTLDLKRMGKAHAPAHGVVAVAVIVLTATCHSGAAAAGNERAPGWKCAQPVAPIGLTPLVEVGRRLRRAGLDVAALDQSMLERYDRLKADTERNHEAWPDKQPMVDGLRLRGGTWQAVLKAAANAQIRVKADEIQRVELELQGLAEQADRQRAFLDVLARDDQELRKHKWTLKRSHSGSWEHTPN